jgi:hypothetical protein
MRCLCLLLLEELQDKLEAEEERRRAAEDAVDKLRGQVEELRRALGALG